MKTLLKLLRGLLLFIIGASVIGMAAIFAGYSYLSPKLPSTDSLKDVQLQVPMRVYSKSGALIAEFGEKRRTPVTFAELPEQMVNAFLSAEDDRFFEHPGVDYQGLLRAGIYLIRTGEKGQGGSTITMQVARNFFLSREKTYLRKINEILLALKIERELSKTDILELYLNKIYLGNRAYGVEAAAQVYYGKHIGELSLAQIAMIAGLPKAPSRYNPIVNPKRALQRRGYVLGRMRSLGFITEEAFKEAVVEPVSSSLHVVKPEIEAPYVAEMVRAEMFSQHGKGIYTSGLNVFTTLDDRRQRAANVAFRNALIAYDQRHGFRGAERHVMLRGDESESDWQRMLSQTPTVGGLAPVLVTGVQEQQVTLYSVVEGEVVIDWKGLSWARPYIDDNRVGAEPKLAEDILKVGDVVRIAKAEDGSWQMRQIPDVSGALVALSPENGSLQALVGGFDFYQSKFNRAVQAKRQPGSNFKPFIYSAALGKGYTAASLINDAPVVFEDAALESAWRPENYSGKFFGPTRLRFALTKSRNLVSIRLLRAIGVNYAIDYVSKFGFDGDRLPRNLSLSLGSGTVTPLELVTAYAIFANGGYRVEPYFISRIEKSNGEVVFSAKPATVCRWCEGQSDGGEMKAIEVSEVAPQPDAVPVEEPLVKPENIAESVVSPQIVYLMNTIMRDVVQRGTGRRALTLGRKDLAGKTGTTNDQRDAWFSGFNHAVVATAWVGFDQVRPLGNRETGGRAALPMWIDFMREALDGVPEQPLEQPSGLVTVRIDPKTGMLATSGQPGAMFETFRSEYVPKAETIGVSVQSGSETTTEEEPLF
ncbi:peptidase [Solemya pervernicosa gill symbiont]|uniref:Penicillin-binding protein 1A n=2 Tax=Gammaproteobacteria incertae sedis TaxID=118884 RepID=A0A1T2LB67_9GAMM|nr:penicillin-binding protein 1A [Candidatus Reidiella endopervernicosa]OOZ42294.1 peptidase [Solemya pervernicosa gill symbiont]QKQ25690.1 penicillin-binding protein 1A [Candidatus Reidiella endopervernicosa]